MSRSNQLLLEKDAVRSALQALTRSQDNLTLLKEERVVFRSDWDEKCGKVGIVSGGGSGHEPFAAGLVGPGGLTAAVAGSVFASPPAGAVLAALRQVATPQGVMLIVFNYTGDRINFGLAAQRARAEGIKVSVHFIQDDCALESEDKAVGRRGLLGGIATIKIMGAASERGYSLDQMQKLFENVTDQTRLGTIGFSVSGCSLPVGESGIKLAPGEVELGLGVHGEPGIKRSKFESCPKLIGQLMPSIQRRLNLTSSDEVFLLFNNLGGLTEIEMLNILGAIQNHVTSQTGAKVVRVGMGHIMTSLDMAGANFTLLKVNPYLLSLLNAPADISGWPKLFSPGSECILEKSQIKSSKQSDEIQVNWDQPSWNKLIKTVCSALINSEKELNDLDAVAGDGDCGSTVKLGAEAVLKVISGNFGSPSALLFAIAGALEDEMGGSSGSLLSLLFTAFAADIRLAKEEISIATLSRALGCGIKAMMDVGRAEEGDRTMLDALIPAQKALITGDLTKVAQAAENGAEKTKTLTAKAGRASYCKERNIDNAPDAGAVMVAKAFRSLC